MLQKQNEFFPGIKEFVKQQRLKKTLLVNTFQQHLKNKNAKKQKKLYKKMWQFCYKNRMNIFPGMKEIARQQRSKNLTHEYLSVAPEEIRMTKNKKKAL